MGRDWVCALGNGRAEMSGAVWRCRQAALAVALLVVLVLPAAAAGADRIYW